MLCLSHFKPLRSPQPKRLNYSIALSFTRQNVSQTQMTDFPILLYTSTSEIPTLLYTPFGRSLPL